MVTSTLRCSSPKSNWRTRLAGSVRYFLILFLLFFIGSDLNAQITIDGNPADWGTLFTNGNPNQFKQFVRDKTVNDNAFTIGSSDVSNVNTWGWNSNGANDKTDIINGGVYYDQVSKIVYFFADRLANNGDAAVGFWILQNGTTLNGTTTGTFTGTHAIGDILVISHFQNGGTSADIRAYRWNGTSLDDITQSGYFPVVLNAGVNNSTVNVPNTGEWNYTPKSGTAGTYPNNSFFEGSIDLSGLGDFNINLQACTANFLIETRVSQSVSASLGDFVLGQFSTPPGVPTLQGSIICGPNTTGTITLSSAKEPSVTYTLKSTTDPNFSMVLANNATQWTGVPAGTYYAVASNPLGCTTNSANVTLAVTTITLTPSSTNVSCFGGSNGTASVVASGGGSSYTYTLTPGNVVNTTGSFSGLTAGNYTVSVTNGTCTASTPVVVSGPTAAVSATANATGVSCFGGSNGIIAGTVSGGTAPYSVMLMQAGVQVGTTQTVNSNGGSYSFGGLNAGNYTVMVTDNAGTAGGCATSQNATVSAPTQLMPTASAVATNPPCFGGTGSITLTRSATGGTGAITYTYAWTKVGDATYTSSAQNPSGLTAGTYNVVVTATDANGCSNTANASATIVVPTQVSPTASAVATNPPCFGGTGSIALTRSATGGTGAITFTYAWTKVGDATYTSSVQNPSGLTAGTYNVVVTAKDANNCTNTATASATVVVPTQVSPTASAVATNPPCFGGTGSITLTRNATGGTGAITFSYAWTKVGDATYTSTAQNPSGLTAGTYNVVVTATDANGCSNTANASATVIVPTQVSPTASAVATNPPCFGGTGSINLTRSATGGTGAITYTYAWTKVGDATFTANTQNLTGLSAGTYNVVVTATDANGCSNTANASATVVVPTQVTPTASAVATNPPCFGGTGSITLTRNASGGTGAITYTYAWTKVGDATYTSSVQNPSGLTAGTYNVLVTATDANGCSNTATASATVVVPTQVVPTASAVATNPPCFGGTGSITLTRNASGGTGAITYTYAWTKVGDATYTSSAQNPSGLTAGTYNVVVTAKDANNCTNTANASATIVVPTQVSPTASAVATNPPCFGGTGSITLTRSATGGTGAITFTYAWTKTGDATYTSSVQNPSGLTAGTYNVVVTATDANGCSNTANASATVVVPTQVTVSASAAATNPGCSNGSGSINLTKSASGGTGAITYTYAWTKVGDASFTASTQNLTGLSSGTYNVVVTATDANGCSNTANASATVAIPTPITVSASAAATNPPCFGGTGSIALTRSASGGTGAITYTYAWTKVGDATFTANTQNLTGLSAGTYNVVVTATDANGCSNTANASATVVVPTQVTVTASAAATNPSCFGGTGSIALTRNASGGTGAISYTYAWTKVGDATFTANTQNLSSLTAGTYNVVVTATDANGCSNTANASATVVVPTQVTVTASAAATNPPCFGGTGSITLTRSASGGTGAITYTYAWTKVGDATYSSTAQNPSGLTAGTYNVVVTAKDANNCTNTANASATIVVPTQVMPTASASATNPPCFGGTGSITLTRNATGGTGAITFSYAWTKVGDASYTSSAQNPSGLTAGTYNVLVTATDANGCSNTTTASATVVVPTQVMPTASAVATNPPCFGGTGSITLTRNASGGTGAINFTYAWTKVGDATYTSSAQNPSGLTAGTYNVVVTATDANGCSNTANASATVVVPTQVMPTASAVASNPPCFGGTGSITLTRNATGGTGAITYTYAWTKVGDATYSSTVQNPSGLTAGTYNVVVTAKDANNCTNTATASATIVVPTQVMVSASAAATNPTCQGQLMDGSIMLTRSASGGTGAITFTYAWTKVGDASWSSTAQNPTGLTAGTYNVVVTAKDANNCTNTAMASATLVNPVCGAPFVTYTQGFYGGKGKGCDGVKQYSSPIEMIAALLSQGPITLGDPAGKYVMIQTSEAAKVNEVMPGGGTASSLPAGTKCDMLTGCSSILTKQGRIGNVLLSQTLALTLNSRMAGLGNFALPYNGGSDMYFYVQSMTGSCGSGDPVACSYRKITISASIVNYLTANGTKTATVTDLLALSNKLLGGTLMPGSGVPSYADLNNAISALNEGFDEWAWWTGQYNTNLTNPTLSGVSITTDATCNPTSASISHSGSTGAPYQYMISWTTKAGGSTLANTGWINLTSAPISVNLAGQPNGMYAGTLTVRNQLTGCTTSANFSFTSSCIVMAAPQKATNVAGAVTKNEISKLTVGAYPNPFTDRVRFVIESPVSGQASLEVYNMLGQKVQIVYQGYISAGEQKVVNYTVPLTSRANLIYQFSVDGKKVSGKLLNVKE